MDMGGRIQMGGPMEMGGPMRGPIGGPFLPPAGQRVLGGAEGRGGTEGREQRGLIKK